MGEDVITGTAAAGLCWRAAPRQIESGKVTNLFDIARQENLDLSYISRMGNLATPAPDIVAAILNETLPENVSPFGLAVDRCCCERSSDDSL